MIPRELLYQLEISLEQGSSLSPAVRGWLQQGIQRHRHDVPLEVALCLTGYGARRYRDAALCLAARLIAPNKSPWPAAEKLQHALNHFQGTAWRYLENNPGVFDNLSGYRLELARALSCGLPIPETQRGLYDIISAENRADLFSVTLCQNDHH